VFRGYLQLMRPANMVTAAADALAGYAASGTALDFRLPCLAAASLCLYGGGVVFNDVCDRELDSVERPERPLPSGRARLWRAVALGASLLAAGVALAFFVSILSGLLAIAIGGSALLYDLRAKHHRLAGPAVLGGCRAMNFLLGLSATAAALGDRWYLALLSLAYIAAITAISRGEVHGGTRRTGLLALILEGSVAVGLAALAAASGPNALAAGAILIFLLARVGPPFWRAYLLPEPERIRAAVRAGVLSLVVLDSVVASAYAGAFYGFAVLALLLVASPLARLFPVT
jgi:4-hydroxybenzoate polyprenyltransferase